MASHSRVRDRAILARRVGQGDATGDQTPRARRVPWRLRRAYDQRNLRTAVKSSGAGARATKLCTTRNAGQHFGQQDPGFSASEGGAGGPPPGFMLLRVRVKSRDSHRLPVGWLSRADRVCRNDAHNRSAEETHPTSPWRKTPLRSLAGVVRVWRLRPPPKALADQKFRPISLGTKTRVFQFRTGPRLNFPRTYLTPTLAVPCDGKSD